jgi:hypothetical protein
MNEQQNHPTDDASEWPPVDPLASASATLREKLIDALTPGYQVEFDPDEAEQAGAFVEDALSEEDAMESNADLMDATVPDDPQED